MAHSYVTDNYNLVDREPKEDRSGGGFTYIWPMGQWVVFHDNNSGANSPVSLVIRAIDGEELAIDDPRRVEVKLPFGLLAEFVGYRVCCDRIKAAEAAMDDPRSVLGLADR